VIRSDDPAAKAKFTALSGEHLELLLLIKGEAVAVARLAILRRILMKLLLRSPPFALRVDVRDSVFRKSGEVGLDLFGSEPRRHPDVFFEGEAGIVI